MDQKGKTREEFLAEIEELKLRLIESEETINAIRSGEVDALVVSSPDGDQIYSLEGADRAYRTLIEEMSEGAAILMDNGSIFYCNNRLADMVNLPLEEMTGNLFDKFILPADRFMYEALFKKCLERNSSSGELSLKASDGSRLPVYISLKNLRLNNVKGISLNVTDLTEQKLNEEILASERLSRYIFEQAGEAIIVCDADGVIIRANEISYSLCKENPILQYFNNVFRLHNKDMEIFPINTALRGQLVDHMEVFLEKENGDRSYFLLNARTINNDKNEVIGCVVILTDINERIKSEEEKQKLLEDSRRYAEELEVSNEELQAITEELQSTNEELSVTTEELQVSNDEIKQSRKLLQDLINGYPSIIFVKDLDGRFIIINNKLGELLGVTNEYLKGKTDYDVFTKEEAEYYRAHDRKVLKEGKALTIIEEADLADGHHTFLANKFPLYDINGNPYGVGSISSDITEMKNLEDELRQARDNLEEKVEERTVELEEAINELKRSNRELQSFAYITSHDLQEPLRTIASYAQLLQRRYEGQLDQDADEFIDYMVSGAIRMKEQIQGLLEYSRVGTQGGKFKVFNAGVALNTALSNLKIAINECNAEVNSDSLPDIFGDESQITRVFQNLIGNALKFHREGVNPKIQISANKTKDEKGFVFSVEDNGIGIESQYTDHIFDVFKRLHAIGEYQGAGIGLAIVKRIIDRHHGRIWIESEYGKGSTFYFTIPIKE